VTRFQLHQDVAVVEHDDATRKPREGGKVIPAMIVRAADDSSFVQARGDGLYGPLSFWRDSGWPAWTGRHTCRLVPLCYFCGEPITGEPVTEPGDPLKREWGTGECHEDSAEAWAGQHYPSGVAT
jgi:hypothetical protein